MRSTGYCTGVFVLSVLCLAAPLALMIDQAAGQSPRARIVTVEGAATTYQVQGSQGQTVTVDVPSQSVADIKLSDPARGTVSGTVLSLDGESNQVKIHTGEGQKIVLEIPHETVMSLRLGDTFTLAVAQPK